MHKLHCIVAHMNSIIRIATYFHETNITGICIYYTVFNSIQPVHPASELSVLS